jgi:tetratricopeptide (TPR) repeat protein
MKSNSTLALVLMLGGAFVAPPALAKPKPQSAAAAPAAPGPTLSAAERAALLPIQNAVNAKDWAAASAALPAAEAAAQGPDAKYYLGQFKRAIGIGSNNDALQAQGVEAMLASGVAPAAQLPILYRHQAVLGLRIRNLQMAESGFSKELELVPGDSDTMVDLAKVEFDLRRPAQAVELMERAIAAKRAAGQPVDQNWYRYALSTAYNAKLAAPSMRLARAMVAAYPTHENWRDSVLVYRDLTTLDKSAGLDMLRLLRATKSLAGERDWLELASELNDGGLPGEAKAVLEEGAAMHQVDLTKGSFADLLRTINVRIAGDRAGLATLETRAMAAATGTTALSTADAYYGYGDYAKAVALYHAALAKGGVDPNIVNLRLGMTLMAMGDRAGAEPAFRAVSGSRADIAGFWLAWAASPPTA